MKIVIKGITCFIIVMTASLVYAEQTNRESPVGEMKKFRFVVLADSRGNDTGINTSVIKQILARIKGLQPQPDFAVIPGDLVVGHKKTHVLRTQLHYFKRTITQFYPIQFYHVGIGNHEVQQNPEGEVVFMEVFPERKMNYFPHYHKTVYFFDHGPARFFMLNTDHPGEEHTIAQKQLDWVRKNINPQNKFNVFFMHQPSYPTGYNIGNSLDIDSYLRNIFWDFVDSLNGAIVFNGHEHFYSRRHIDRDYNEIVDGKEFTYEKKVYQVTIGGFGGPLTSNFESKAGVDVPPIGQYHFAVVDVDENTLTVSVYDLEGKILDSFSL